MHARTDVDGETRGVGGVIAERLFAELPPDELAPGAVLHLTELSKVGDRRCGSTLDVGDVSKKTAESALALEPPSPSSGVEVKWRCCMLADERDVCRPILVSSVVPFMALQRRDGNVLQLGDNCKIGHTLACGIVMRPASLSNSK